MTSPADLITPEAVIAAICDGHDTIDTLAAHFGVKHVSWTLRHTLYGLAEAGEVIYADIDGVRHFSAEW